MVQMKNKNLPSFKEENYYWSYGIDHVIGIDEVGRGAFAGPIVAAGVIFSRDIKLEILEGITDSKLLTSIKRVKYSEIIQKNAMHFAIEEVDVDFINEHGIGKANREVFHKVLKSLIKKINTDKYFCLIDGHGFDVPQHKGIIKGDTLSLSIAAASIIAKVYRDNLMTKLAIDHPEYFFEKNKGYGTKFHRDAIQTHGISKIHRSSFIH